MSWNEQCFQQHPIVELHKIVLKDLFEQDGYFIAFGIGDQFWYKSYVDLITDNYFLQMPQGTVVMWHPDGLPEELFVVREDYQNNISIFTSNNICLKTIELDFTESVIKLWKDHIFFGLWEDVKVKKIVYNSQELSSIIASGQPNQTCIQLVDINLDLISNFGKLKCIDGVQSYGNYLWVRSYNQFWIFHAEDPLEISQLKLINRVHWSGKELNWDDQDEQPASHEDEDGNDSVIIFKYENFVINQCKDELLLRDFSTGQVMHKLYCPGMETVSTVCAWKGYLVVCYDGCAILWRFNGGKWESCTLQLDFDPIITKDAFYLTEQHAHNHLTRYTFELPWNIKRLLLAGFMKNSSSQCNLGTKLWFCADITALLPKPIFRIIMEYAETPLFVVDDETVVEKMLKRRREEDDRTAKRRKELEEELHGASQENDNEESDPEHSENEDEEDE